MKNIKPSVIFAITGELLDIATTFWGLSLGMIEINLLLHISPVKLIIAKLIITAIVALFIQRGKSPSMRYMQWVIVAVIWIPFIINSIGIIGEILGL